MGRVLCLGVCVCGDCGEVSISLGMGGGMGRGGFVLGGWVFEWV